MTCFSANVSQFCFFFHRSDFSKKLPSTNLHGVFFQLPSGSLSWPCEPAESHRFPHCQIPPSAPTAFRKGRLSQDSDGPITFTVAFVARDGVSDATRPQLSKPGNCKQCRVKVARMGFGFSVSVFRLLCKRGMSKDNAKISLSDFCRLCEVNVSRE